MSEGRNDADIDNLKDQALKALSAITTVEALEQWRVSHLGRKSRLTSILRGLGTLTPDQRRLVGTQANQLKVFIEREAELRKDSLQNASIERLSVDKIDISLPGVPVRIGRYHPSTLIVREVCNIFVSMGFQVVEGPEVEWDLYNFERLNIPRDHPARDQWNTLWVDTMQNTHGEYPMLMRTHTSPIQARIMESTIPPIRVVVPGKVWRYEATDATHESQFFQIEGLAVDEGVSFANLRHTLYEFARRMFGNERKVRFRCDYFPFVEPGGRHVYRLFRLSRR